MIDFARQLPVPATADAERDKFRRRASHSRPQCVIEHWSQCLGTLAADDQERAIGQGEPDTPIAAPIKRVAIATGSNPPESVIGDRPEAHDLRATHFP